MNLRNGLKVIALFFGIALGFSCQDAWEEHNELLNKNSSLTLLDKIAADPSLSMFYAYLKQAGLDSALASSKTYTVWAPDNSALTALNAQSPDYLADTANLNRFVRNHIATLLYPVTSNMVQKRVLTLNGLYVDIDGGHYEEANLKATNLLAKNGALNIIDQALAPKASVFGVAKSIGGAEQVQAMSSLDTMGLTTEGLIVIKRSPRWSTLARSMSSPDSLFTYFVLENTPYANELQKILPYYRSTKTKPDSTQEALTKLAMIENLLVRGRYEQGQLPDTLISVGGTKMPINKAAITASYRANNGIVYVMSQMPYRLKDRIREFKIEGEQTTDRTFSRNDKGSSTFYRTQLDDKGIPFKDIEVYGHGVSEFYIQYRKQGVHSTTYKVYARAVSNTTGDKQTAVFTQRYGVPSATNFAQNQILFTHVVNPSTYTEVYLGEYTVNQQGSIIWRLVSAASTSTNINTLILDYLRFEPVLP